MLLNGGVAPEVAGDGDEQRVSPLTRCVGAKTALQEQSLIHDLVATGKAVLAGTDDAGPARRRTSTCRADASQLHRLTVLTGLTSNVVAERRALDRRGQRQERLDGSSRCSACSRRSGSPSSGLLSWALVVSTRRRSAHFRSLVTSTTDLVLVFSGEQCRYASNSVLRMIDCTEAAVLGDGIIEYVHPEDRAALRNVLRTGEPATVEFRLPDAKRGLRALEANVTDLRDDRHVRGIVLNARDVTERNRIEAERERLLEQELEANERLRELDRLKDEFVALVSHEVRTPLTSILGYLELLSDEELTDGAAVVHGHHRPELRTACSA